MKILLLSDTHGFADNIRRVFAAENVRPDAVGGIDYIIHCGDVEGQADLVRRLFPGPVCIVKGNCDDGSDLPMQRCFSIAGHKIYIIHGHTCGIHNGLRVVQRMAKREGADIVCFGHTHVPCVKNEDGMWFLNPGSASLPRQPGRMPTYMVLEINGNEITPDVRFLV